MYPGHMGTTTLGAERASNPFLAELAQVAVAAKLQAPRGTFDVLPADGRRRAALARTTDDGARARRLRAVRDAGVRGHRAVRARRGGGHGHRAQGDVHLRGQGRPLAHAAARGHGGRLPRLRRARHAQAAAAGEAALLGPVLPARGAAGGPLPAVHAAGRRGARLRRPVARRRARSCCSWSSLEAVGARGPPGAAVEPRHAGDAGGTTSAELGALPARARVRALRRRARPARHQPAARLRLRPRRHPRGHGGGAAAARPARPRRRRALRRRCASCSTTPASPTRSTPRSCAGSTTTRARSSRSSPERSARRTRSAAAGATTGWWSSSAGPARRAWASPPGVERILLAAAVDGRDAGPGGVYVALAEPDATRARRSRSRGACASAACAWSWSRPAARSRGS